MTEKKKIEKEKEIEDKDEKREYLKKLDKKG